MADIEYISTDKAPRPGSYSQAARVVLGDRDKLVFLAGQTGNVPEVDNQPVAEGGVGPQTIQALKNILAVVSAAGGDVEHIIEVKVFLKDSEASGVNKHGERADARMAFNRAYVEFFRKYGRTSENHNLPARTLVWVAEVPLEFPTEDTLVEITATAVIPRLFLNG